MNQESKKKILVISGATASGKTDLAFGLNKNHEMISVDSRQIYKGTAIASAQPETEQKNKHTYHFINFLEAGISYSAPEFANNAARTIESIHKKEKIPVLVGGAGFYLQALLQGYNNSKEISNEAKEQTDILFLKWKSSPDKLWKFFHEKDKNAASKIHPHDLYRIRRAIELIFNGQIPTHLKQAKKKQVLKTKNYDFLYLYLDWSRESLYNRINKRMEQIWNSGFLKEYQTLRDAGYSLKDPGMLSLGYNLLDEYLQKKIDREELLNLLARSHRKYAKKQICWFRSKSWLTPLDMNKETKEDILKKIYLWENK